MCKFLAGAIAFATISIFVRPALSKPAHPIQAHDAAEVAGFCGAVGGSFGIWDSPGGGIVFTCTWGPTQSQQVSCHSSKGLGAKGICASNYDPRDPREPKLPPPKGKKGGASKNTVKPSDKVNTAAGLSNIRSVGNALPDAAAKTNVNAGATTAPNHTSPPITARSGLTAAPAKPAPANTAGTLGGGAFGRSTSPAMPGPTGVASRRFP